MSRAELKTPPRLIKKLNLKRHEQIAMTVYTICMSPYINEYIIGYTSRQGLLRADEHRRNGFDNLVILADRLVKDEALWLEEVLQSYIHENKTMNIYRKYAFSKRALSYRRSAGSRPAPAAKPVHAVYMAWSTFPDE